MARMAHGPSIVTVIYFIPAIPAWSVLPQERTFNARV